MNILLLVLGWIALVGGIALLVTGKILPKETRTEGNYREEAKVVDHTKRNKFFTRNGIIIAIIAIPLIVLGSSFTIIPTGQVGAIYEFGVLQKGSVRSAGLQWHTPFIQEIREHSVMQENANEAAEETARIWGESKDKLPIYCRDVRITYQINPNGLMYLLENVAEMSELKTWGKTVASAFSAATINLDDVDVAKQSLVEPLMLEEMQRLTDAKYGKTSDGESNIIVVRVLIGELDYEEAYQTAITNRKNAEQAAIEQEVMNKKNEAQKISEAEQARIEAEGKANASIETAKGEAEAIKLKAEAEAEANRKIAASITDSILKQKELEARLKHGWVTVQGGSVIVDERDK